MAQKVGRIVNYLDHIGVAVMEVDTGTVKVGDQIRIGEEGEGLEMEVGSMQMDHQAVDEVGKGQDCGLKVESAVKKGSSVYKL
jgi:translation initiation factor IF-2